MQDRGLADTVGSWRVGTSADVALGVVSLRIGTMKGSACNVPDNAQAWGACGGAYGPPKVCCEDLLATRAMRGSDVAVALYVTRTARDGRLLEGPL